MLIYLKKGLCDWLQLYRNPLNMFYLSSKEMDEHSTVSKHADADMF